MQELGTSGDDGSEDAVGVVATLQRECDSKRCQGAEAHEHIGKRQWGELAESHGVRKDKRVVVDDAVSSHLIPHAAAQQDTSARKANAVVNTAGVEKGHHIATSKRAARTISEIVPGCLQTDRVLEATNSHVLRHNAATRLENVE